MGTQKKKEWLQNRKTMQFSHKILEIKVRILGRIVEARIN